MIPSPSQLLGQYGLAPKYSFGQNFLCDRNYTEKIAALATPEPGLHVLELGAGLGALTDALLDRACNLAVVERDRDLVPVLRELFAAQVQSGRLLVVEDDAKQVDFVELLTRLGPAQDTASWVITGNLPYQITGPLLEKTVHLSRRIKRAVFLVQKEVADRLAAVPSTKEYGALTVFVQAQFSVERAFVIKPGAFVPRPRVESAVVVLRPHESELTAETPTFRQVVKLAFSARRKTLRNAWKALGSPSELEQLAGACGITLDQRGETLSPRQFAQAGRALELLRHGTGSSV